MTIFDFAMVLPGGEAEYPDDLAEYFATDGSWGTGAVSLFSLLAVATNVVLFHAPVTDPVNLLNILLGLVAALVAVLQNRGWLVA